MTRLVEPNAVTNFARTDRELELFWLFSIFVMGNNSDQAANTLERLAGVLPHSGRVLLYLAAQPDLTHILLTQRTGKYVRFTEIIRASAALDLRTVDCEELERIKGVGRKTSRFFLLHSRKNMVAAALDRHLLLWLRTRGYNTAPRATPYGKKIYQHWEIIAISEMKHAFPTLSLAEADLEIWRMMRAG